jgi:pimeloyl-ACP methyl ester carboxylesterase
MKSVAGILLLAILQGCGPTRLSPDLNQIYGAAARQSHVDRNPIIVIPGILGSRLVDESLGKVAWGAFGKGAVRLDSPEGMRSLALPFSQQGWPKDEIRPDGVLSQLRVSFGYDFRFKAYSGMLAAFGLGGYLDPELTEPGALDYGSEHFTCFQFAYDWRRSCAENAALLGNFIEEKRRYVAKERKRLYSSDAPVRFDLVAHSMGGLVARYHLMYGGRPLARDGNMPVDWSGSRHVEKLIVVGTPNGGSVYPVKDLQNGFQLAPLLPRMPAAVIASMPSVYELLPPGPDQALTDESGAAFDYYDVAEWDRRGWGMLAPAQDETLAVLLPDIHDAAGRRRKAVAQLEKLLHNARAFHRAINRPGRPPEGLEIHAFAGDAMWTASRARILADGGVEFTGWTPGDGSVTRASVLRDLRTPGEAARRLHGPIPWEHAHFVFSDHVKMTSDPAFVDNVLHLLLEKPR